MERRNSPRIPLDVPCLLTLFLEGEACPAMLIDISAGGVHLALSPGPGGDALRVHAKASLADVPGKIGPVLNDREGAVAWVAERHCGIRLNEALPFSVDELIEMTPL